MSFRQLYLTILYLQFRYCDRYYCYHLISTCMYFIRYRSDLHILSLISNQSSYINKHNIIFFHFFQVWLGPNAVLAFKREGYKWSDINLKDLTEILTYRGFYKLAAKYVKFGSMEMLRSIFISLSGKQLRFSKSKKFNLKSGFQT